MEVRLPGRADGGLAYVVALGDERLEGLELEDVHGRGDRLPLAKQGRREGKEVRLGLHFPERNAAIGRAEVHGEDAVELLVAEELLHLDEEGRPLVVALGAEVDLALPLGGFLLLGRRDGLGVELDLESVTELLGIEDEDPVPGPLRIEGHLVVSELHEPHGGAVEVHGELDLGGLLDVGDRELDGPLLDSQPGRELLDGVKRRALVELDDHGGYVPNGVG